MDYGSITIQFNGGTGATGTDALPVWTGPAVNFSGGGADELRFVGTGGAGNIGSASWTTTNRPLTGSSPVQQLWMYHQDAVGYQVTTYDGGRTNSRVLRLSFSGDGTFASTPRLTAFANTTHPVPTPGTQPAGTATDGTGIINGSADTNNRSYLKGNVYGCGYSVAGGQETPPAGGCGTTLSATCHSADGSAVPADSAWLATWQDLQGFLSYITLSSTPKATTAFFLYFSLSLFMGVSMTPGVMSFPAIVWDYTYA